MVGELVGVEPLAVPGGAHLREQVDVETAGLEYPCALAPVVVNGVEVMEFGNGGTHAGERVVFGIAQVRVTFDEYRIVVVRIERVLLGVGIPLVHAAKFAAGR